jgi:hypothetical protein
MKHLIYGYFTQFTHNGWDLWGFCLPLGLKSKSPGRFLFLAVEPEIHILDMVLFILFWHKTVLEAWLVHFSGGSL